MGSRVVYRCRWPAHLPKRLARGIMYDRPVVVTLRDYLAILVDSNPPLLDAHRPELRQRVCAVVDEFKLAGWPPERVIVAVKQIANDAGLSSTRHVLAATSVLSEQEAAIVHIVRWCVERYYAPTDGPTRAS